MRSLYPNGRRDQTAAWLVVEVGLLRADGPPGYGEGNHEVIDWDELGALAVTPLAGVMVMALGTTAVATGLGLGHGLSALPALQGDLPGGRCAAM